MIFFNYRDGYWKFLVSLHIGNALFLRDFDDCKTKTSWNRQIQDVIMWKVYLYGLYRQPMNIFTTSGSWWSKNRLLPVSRRAMAAMSSSLSVKS